MDNYYDTDEFTIWTLLDLGVGNKTYDNWGDDAAETVATTGDKEDDVADEDESTHNDNGNEQGSNIVNETRSAEISGGSEHNELEYDIMRYVCTSISCPNFNVCSMTPIKRIELIYFKLLVYGLLFYLEGLNKVQFTKICEKMDTIEGISLPFTVHLALLTCP